MSHLENKLKWCFDKAKRELAEKNKHRGLIQIEPNFVEAEKHLRKAEHNFNGALYFEKGGYSDWSTSAFFYCLYHCFLAIIAKFGYESRNQECTIALIKQLKLEGKIQLDSQIIDSFDIQEIDQQHEENIIQVRENFQYGTATSVNDEKLKKLKDLCLKAIAETKTEIY